ncbi:hypothetical protein [Methylobacterium oryzihabitans]|uniref:Uncharacterized protein n=1 Tax=Methylobacterium oryzihabitans TaxID=2499852 RepID=A0A437PFU9_9HYPH|nr:hypothetical protein [Methylobacterium oryzihabitans]RVU21063.1 hypothetical protein EOE48_02910 [Methylobacterium oryzihabitans]
MSDFDARNLDDVAALTRLAEILHPTPALRSQAKARGRRRLRAGIASLEPRPPAASEAAQPAA